MIDIEPCELLPSFWGICYTSDVKPSFSKRVAWPIRQNELSQQVANRKMQGFDILNFAESNPTRVGLDRDRQSLLDPLVSDGALQYAPDPHGLGSAREALAEFGPGSGGRLTPGQYFLCSSTSEAYAWLFKLLCEPGDAVLVPKPGYPLFDFLAGLECVEARPYFLEYIHPKGWRIDIDRLKKAFADGRVKAIILINPNNPTGSFIGEEERRRVIELARIHGVALIVDEVFFGFPLEAGEHSSFVGEEGVLTFTLNGLSKLLGLPQMKLGWIAASGPKDELDEAIDRLEIVADTYLSAGTPVMQALPAFLSFAPRFAAELGLRLSGNLAMLRDTLERAESPHRVLLCEGGWTALIEAPRVASEEELAMRLLVEEGLYIHPGYFFDMEREAFFAASLLLPPREFSEASLRYRAFFDRILI